MNLNVKILNKVLANFVQQILRRLYTMTKLILFQRCKDSLWKSINVIHHISRIKDKNHLICSVDAEKVFNKIKHPFIIKALKKLGIEAPES